MRIENLTTLCYLEQDDCYLMLHRVKKEQDINKHKWIGVGGHFEADESPEECVKRETYEETGLTLLSVRLRGIVTFVCDLCETEYMFLYTSDDFLGEMKECDEGNLEWIPKNQVCDLPIWEGDKIFFDLLRRKYPFFSLKLVYQQDRLVRAVLDGEELHGKE